MSPITSEEYRPGLEGVVAAETRLSHVDGEAGELLIGGYTVEALAPEVTFEETIGLLWDGKLPDAQRLESLRAELASRRVLPVATRALLDAAARDKADLMDALRMAVASLSLGAGPETPRETALRATAAFPVIVAHAFRVAAGKQPVEPRPELGHAASYLHLLEGELPSPARVRALETYLNTVVDHGMNASTFTARVIIATQSDVISALTGAIGALKGPLHGGAPGPALDMVFEIGSADKADAYLRAKIERGDRLMGFGHRVYKVRDPRADVLAAAADQLAAGGENRELYDLARAVEGTALRLLEEFKPGRRLQTNVEFYTALVLHAVGMSQELFTPTFAVGRAAGWCAHCFEQLAEGRLIRPASRFVGDRHPALPPLAAR